MGYQTEEEKIEEEFTELIRDGLTEEQFWNWISGWMDRDEICEHAEEWSILDKQETIIKLKNKFNLN